MSVLAQSKVLHHHLQSTKYCDDINNDSIQPSLEVVECILSDQYVQKAWKIASKVIGKHDAPDLFPHFSFPGLPYYTYNDSSFWTSGFFPGIVWVLYERSLRTPLQITQTSLLEAARKWQVELVKEQYKTDNHDLGFMIMPSFARDYDLTSSPESLQIVLNAAEALSTRYSSKVRAIKSWEGARTKKYNFNNPELDFVVVIDSMMNLDLLYWASEKSGNKKYADIATTHATTTLKNHIRPNHSSYHLVNYDATTGAIRNRVTNQGYANESTWARGQAWALYGFATVYRYTRQESYLDAARLITEYFLSQIDDDGVVYWDFDAPQPGVWDVSAATCACSGMLLLQQLAPQKCNYLRDVLMILDTVTKCATSKGDALLERSTMNDHEHALQRTAEHGVVYADYYFLEAGNRLVEMGARGSQ